MNTRAQSSLQMKLNLVKLEITAGATKIVWEEENYTLLKVNVGLKVID